MTKQNIKQTIQIEYLYHSGFRIETDTHILIFDYYQGDLVLSNKKILVFCSHSHADHFNPQIFMWQNQKSDIEYILSSDIDIKYKLENTHYISAYEEIILGDVKVKAYGSTDCGVSFLVQCSGACIFHAGDLNWWHWWRDIPEEIAKAELLFKEEISKLKGEQIDIAFFPVDPRLEQYAYLGADYLIQEITPKYLIPMHFGDDNEAAELYAKKRKASLSKVLAATQNKRKIQITIK